MEETLQKNDIVECTADGLGMDGEGVAHPSGKTLFVRGVLPGERFRAKIIKVMPRFDVGLLERVLSPSTERRTPPCPLFGKCGGCDLMHLSYPAQLAFKRECVASQLHKAGLDVAVAATVPSPAETGYRNKASLPVRRGKDGGTIIGFFARGSHRVIDLRDCPLQAGPIAALVAAMREFMASEGLSGYDEDDFSGDVRELVVRIAGGALCVTVVATRRVNLAPLARTLCELSPGCELWLNINASRGNAVFGKEFFRVSGSGAPARIEGLALDLHPAAFLQVNDGVREKLYARAASLVTGGTAIEAYSGAGLLSARLALAAGTVYGIEINERAHEAALDLCARNNITNFFPVCGDVADMLPALLRTCASGELPLRGTIDFNEHTGAVDTPTSLDKRAGNADEATENNTPAASWDECARSVDGAATFNNVGACEKSTSFNERVGNVGGATWSTNDITVVVDPPRAGLSEKVRETLIAAAPPRIIYISCNPATLARDLAALSPRYTISSVEPFDMFPQTANVETLVVLSHKNHGAET